MGWRKIQAVTAFRMASPINHWEAHFLLPVRKFVRMLSLQKVTRNVKRTEWIQCILFEKVGAKRRDYRDDDAYKAEFCYFS